MKLILLMHIVAGAISLISGYFALFTPKGSGNHRKSGLFFFLSTLSVGLSGMILSITSHSLFLLHISLFTMYQVVSGKRAIAIRHERGIWFDWTWSICGAINGIWMLSSMQLLGLIFGIIQFSLAITDLAFFYRRLKQRTPKRNEYQIRHLGLMIGALIASTTAFVVVNISVDGLYWIPWVLPSLLLVPLIVYHSRKLSAEQKD